MLIDELKLIIESIKKRIPKKLSDLENDLYYNNKIEEWILEQKERVFSYDANYRKFSYYEEFKDNKILIPGEIYTCIIDEVVCLGKCVYTAGSGYNGSADSYNIEFKDESESKIIQFEFHKFSDLSSDVDDGMYIRLISGYDGYGGDVTVDIGIVRNKVELQQLDENVIPDTIARISDIPKIAQPDWDQNDESAVDYVKNRTHYSGLIDGNILVDSLTKEEFSGGNIPQCRLIPGNTYKVIWNGEVYDNMVCTLYRGSMSILGGDRLVSEESYPFFIFNANQSNDSLYIGATTNTTQQFTISLIEKTEAIKKLDEKYIPDTIARKSDLDAIDLSAYETTESANAKLDVAKSYTDTLVDETKSYVNDAISNVAYIDIEDDSVDVESGLTLAEINDRVDELSMSTVNTGWLKDNNGEKFAPKTLSSQVITSDGISIDTLLDNTIVDDGDGNLILGADATEIVVAPHSRGVDYDNAVSGLSATNVQDAMDEVATLLNKNQNEIENLTTLPYGGSKDWLENNGDVSQLYQIDGYVYGYIEGNGWVKSNKQFLVVSNENEMTNKGGTSYLLREGNTGTVYSYTEPSGDTDTPLYEDFPNPESVNDGDIIAVAPPVVNSVEEMTDTSTSYTLKSTNTIWDYLTTTIEIEPPELYDPSKIIIGKRHSGTPGTIVSGSNYFMTDYIPIDMSVSQPKLEIYGDINLQGSGVTHPIFQKLAMYDSNKNILGSRYISKASNSADSVFNIQSDGVTTVYPGIVGGEKTEYFDQIAYVLIEVIPTNTTVVASDASIITSIINPDNTTKEVDMWIDTKIPTNKKYKMVKAQVTEPNYTNIASITATDSRINSSGSVVDYTGGIVIDFFECIRGDVIRVKGINILDSTTGYMQPFTTENGTSVKASSYPDHFSSSEDGTITFTVATWFSDAIQNSLTKLRFSGLLTGTVDDVIITKNEEIVDTTYLKSEWVEIGTYVAPIKGGWNSTSETHNVTDDIITATYNGDTSVYSGDGYEYTCIIGASWMELSKYDKKSNIEVDKELSFTSVNPVQNKIIAVKLDEQDVAIRSNTKGIDELNTRIAKLSTSTEEDSLTVPSFWEESVNEVIAKIKALQVGRNCVTFPFFSDNHQRNGYAGLLIAYIMKECHIPYAFFGGDSISSGYIADEATMIAQDAAFDASISYIPKGRFCRAVGNHDGYWAVDASNKNSYTDAQNYELFLREESISQNKHFGGDGTYYYVDDVASKVRFIILDTNDNVVEDEQLSWLQNVALKFNESNWGVVFISHQPISNHYHAGISNAAALRAIIQNHMNSSDENKADIIGCFSGHVHRDRIYTGVAVNTKDDSEGDAMGFTQVVITSDHTGIAYDDATKHTVANDDQSHAIDFVTVNKTTRTVNLTRLGIGNDRSYTY